MGVIGLAFLSIAFSLLIGFSANKILNNSFGFLRDDEPFLSRYNIFRIIVPSFLLSFSLISIFLHLNSTISKIVQVLMVVYIGVILSWYNRIRNNKRRLAKIRLIIVESVIEPWKRNFLTEDTNYFLNLYYLNKKINGEVTFNTSRSQLKPDAIEEIKTNLSKYNIKVNFREKKNPSLYKFNN
ncbi:hypothetical protein [Paenibacillus xylanivorans]|uniref:Uncharacterized protein n=1 Tax=Paenibacillus xylanivorans TaxID=1705561 RepID=A0A0M9BRL4_9BACL|nr:hypothetical protein [Paenibacillus xylanivorans]KOY16712.1 hypothetical protein AMS66_09935 [Paenibacillus xylanivorans]